MQSDETLQYHWKFSQLIMMAMGMESIINNFQDRVTETTGAGQEEIVFSKNSKFEGLG